MHFRCRPPSSAVTGALFANLLPVIAIPWQPQGGANHYSAVMTDLEGAIPAAVKIKWKTLKVKAAAGNATSFDQVNAKSFDQERKAL